MHLTNRITLVVFFSHVAAARPLNEDTQETRTNTSPNASHDRPVALSLANIIYSFGFFRNSRSSTGNGSGTTSINPTVPAGLQPDEADKGAKMVTLDVVTESNRFYVEIGVGTPPQSFKMVLDTGSADSWVKGRRKSGTDTDTEGKWFDPGTSSSAEPILELDKVLLRYDGDDTGETTKVSMYRETLTIGGVAIPKVAIGVAETWSGQMAVKSSDGIFALGLPELSRSRQNPVLNELIDRGLLPEPSFSLRLRNTLWVDSMIDSDKSTMTLGGFDPEAIDGEFTDVKVIDKRYWLVMADSISVTLTTAPLIVRVHVFFDTGTSILVGGLDPVRQLHKAISGHREHPELRQPGVLRFSIPCDSTAEVIVSFNGRPFHINPEEFIGDQVPDDTTEAFQCWSNIAAWLDSTISYWVLGSPFFASVYAKFTFALNGSPAQVSFAKPKAPQYLPGQGPNDMR